MKPWVRTVLNGAAPLPASESSSEDWNQPRCWSLPSRYMSACQVFQSPVLRMLQFGARIKTAREEEPESIQTSSVSLDLATASAPFQSLGLTSDQSSAADFSNQTFEPCCSIRSAALRTISRVEDRRCLAHRKRRGSARPRCAGARCTSRAALSTAPSMRFLPQSGIHLTRSISSSALLAEGFPSLRDRSR